MLSSQDKNSLSENTVPEPGLSTPENLNKQLSINNSFSSPVNSLNGAQIFYGVYVPLENELLDIEPRVFTDKGEVLNLIKHNKQARFRAFTNESDAIKFSSSGGEVLSCDSPSTNSEKSPLKGPKQDDIIRFKKACQADDINAVRRLLDENPKFLVGNGDTPTIYQEGYRYNAIHIAARSNSTQVCNYILKAVSNTDVIKKLYGSNTDINERKKILLDLYLNMPDKGWNETPLHFASKLGFVEIVKILTSYPECDRNVKNKDGKTPLEVICTRADSSTRIHENEIKNILKTGYFIPVLRVEDNTIPPVIGEPFSQFDSPEVSSPTNDVLSPKLRVKALAGPMSEEEARIFRKKWKTPTRDNSLQRFVLSDPEKGCEHIGRKLAHEFHVSWTEYWPFLGTFIDLASPEGLNLLENYLTRAFLQVKGNEFNMSDLCESISALNLSPSPSTAINTDEVRTHQRSTHIKSITNRDCAEIENSFQPFSYSDFDPCDFAVRSESHFLSDRLQHIISQGYITPFTVGANIMEKSCQVFAVRIANVLTQCQTKLFFLEVVKFQELLSSCVDDPRLNGIDLQKAHYRLSALIKGKVMANASYESVVPFLQEMSLIKKFPMESKKITPDSLLAATKCISQITVSLLPCGSDFGPYNDEICSDGPVLWSFAESCKCPIPVPIVVTRKPPARVLFPECSSEENSDVSPLHDPMHDQMISDSVFTKNDLNISEYEKRRDPSDEKYETSNLSDLSNGDSAFDHTLLNLSPNESERDLSDSDFVTALNSPVSSKMSSSSSSLSDNEFQLAEIGPEVFLAGSQPTKLDQDVLNVLEGVNIPYKKYPHIYAWKHACYLKSLTSPMDSWSTPKRK